MHTKNKWNYRAVRLWRPLQSSHMSSSLNTVCVCHHATCLADARTSCGCFFSPPPSYADDMIVQTPSRYASDHIYSVYSQKQKGSMWLVQDLVVKPCVLSQTRFQKHVIKSYQKNGDIFRYWSDIDMQKTHPGKTTVQRLSETRLDIVECHVPPSKV